ncbi:hypothetical protein PoB_006140400 [Plakobranchus ocellatus]|uniref:Uncharacterized protein n=1 Tax=Plakobranchus ocellatus TaxID=259542 RepID=A0AAV4CSQ6_9GAST|nr:hypothetical protein PoB_006140400 [Plakobranchus ocellatus]
MERTVPVDMAEQAEYGAAETLLMERTVPVDMAEQAEYGAAETLLMERTVPVDMAEQGEDGASETLPVERTVPVDMAEQGEDGATETLPMERTVPVDMAEQGDGIVEEDIESHLNIKACFLSPRPPGTTVIPPWCKRHAGLKSYRTVVVISMFHCIFKSPDDVVILSCQVNAL